MQEARRLYGDMGMISSDERLPKLIWKIGEFDTTVVRGETWDEAVLMLIFGDKKREDLRPA